jgi:hypothetical protein
MLANVTNASLDDAPLQQKRAQMQFQSFRQPVAVLTLCGWGQHEALSGRRASARR